MLLLYAGANRDPQQFPDAAQFRLDRPKGRAHLGFGWAGDITWTFSTEPRHIPVRWR